mmetsp:Transcript_24945/g.53806  ORF Transcript_24945/g.53806 Transcript_24945/m.53806 type:complete len:445 (-) Transcript_24945:162-1496(-)
MTISYSCHALYSLSDEMRDTHIYPLTLICDRLVELLSHNVSPNDVPSRALDTLEIIVRNNSSQAQCIINGVTPHAIPRLLKLLTNGEDHCQQQVCRIINNMIINNISCIQLLMDAEYIVPLIEVLNGAQSYKLKEIACYTIVSMINSGTPVQTSFIVSQCCLQPLCQLLEMGDAEKNHEGDMKVEIAALSGLENAFRKLQFSFQAELSEAANMLYDGGVCNNLVKLLFRDSPQVHCNALIALGYILSKVSSQANWPIDENTLSRLLNLLVDGCVDVQGAVCWVMFWISTDSTCTQVLIETEFFTPLVGALANAHLDHGIARFAPPAMLNMINAGPSDKIMATNGALRQLCILLEIDNTENRVHALDGLNIFFRYLSHRELSGAVNALVGSGVDECLVTLLSNGSPPQVRTQASWILSVELCHALWLQEWYIVLNDVQRTSDATA